MRKECNEEEWSESVAEISSIVGIEQADSHWISRVSQSTNEKLINMLFVKYRLQEHCVMVKKYLLLNQGDFHHALMEGIHSTLDLPPAKIYKHSLVNILEAAIKSSNCQYHDQQFIGRLKVVIEDPKGKNSGWDVFSLEYSVEAPLNTFFSEEISAKYRKVFSFLWKMKRVQFLTHSLDKLKDLIEIQNHPKVFSMLRKMFFIRNQISHFINTFSSYLMVDSIEGLWEKFYLKLNNARDLDELVEIHSSFIDGVMKSCFISEETAFRKILKILDICLNFYHSKKRFLESVKDEHLRMQRPDLDDDILDFVMISQQSFDEIEKISETFPEEILKFKEEELENNDTVKNKNLGVILDFNEFYTNETYVRGCFPEHFSSYREVMQGLNKIARRN
jgi:gamma-tubulin complex component 3